MSKVDWSLAPEWADRVVAGPLSGKEYWANSERRIQTNGEFDCPDQYHILESWELICMKPKPWSGPEDGLPPVGAICEYRLEPSNQWHECEIRYHIKHAHFEDPRAVVWNESLGFDQISGSNWRFRPIRTPEQLAAEDRERAAQDMWQSIEYVREKGVFSFLDLMRALHDQGFKREVK